MLLSINTQKKEISSELGHIQKIRYKLSNQLRHFKQFNQLKIITKLLEKHMIELQTLQRYNIKQFKNLNVVPYIHVNKRINNHILRLGHHVQALLVDAIFIPYATLAYGCLSKIKANLDSIQKKLQIIKKLSDQVARKQQLSDKSKQPMHSEISST